MIFNFIFWGFGFLRMGTTALVAQAKGRKDNQAATDVLMRSLLLASLLGITLWLIQQPLHALVFSLTGASQAVEAATSTYYQIRIWGAPIHLMILAIMGYLLGPATNPSSAITPSHPQWQQHHFRSRVRRVP
jgi:MATE family multidrug resistance protein